MSKALYIRGKTVQQVEVNSNDMSTIYSQFKQLATSQPDIAYVCLSTHAENVPGQRILAEREMAYGHPEWRFYDKDLSRIHQFSSGETVMDECLFQLARKEWNQLEIPAVIADLCRDHETPALANMPGNLTYLCQGLQAGDYSLEHVASGWDASREYLRNKFGDSLTLYRAEIPLSQWQPDVPVVFMTDKKQARAYMKHGRSLNEYQVKIDDIIGINTSSTDDVYSFIVKNQLQPCFIQGPGTEFIVCCKTGNILGTELKHDNIEAYLDYMKTVDRFDVEELATYMRETTENDEYSLVGETFELDSVGYFNKQKQYVEPDPVAREELELRATMHHRFS